MSNTPSSAIHGTTAPRFAAVRDVFAENFRARREVGASLVVRQHGQVVVDLWGGLADPHSGRAWEQNTPAVVFSVTKGLVAIVVLMLTEEGILDLDAPVSRYWPAFAGQGRDSITVKMLLSHRAGLAAIDEPLTLPDFADREKVSKALVAQTPLWIPGTDQGYHGCSFGPYVGELVWQATGKTVGQLFAEKVARPLGIDAWLGMPPEIWPTAARLVPATTSERLIGQIPTALFRFNADGRLFRRVLLGKRTLSGKAFLNPTLGPTRFEALNDPAVLALELLWMDAMISADALCTAYAALLGEVRGVRLVRPESIAPLAERHSWSARDLIMQKPMGWTQGFLKEEGGVFSPHPRAFGHPGAGGALGWADPEAGLAIGYVMNHMDWRIRSPRALALCDAIYRCL